MAYNNYGQMYNPYSGYPVNPQNISYAYNTPAQQPQMSGMIWVDGEVGAKAFQMPQGYPVGTYIALWDTNDQVIYLKSINQMGMPNPLQKIRYQIEEQPQQSGYLPAASQVSGAAESNYVTKDDFERKMNELKEMFKNSQSSRNQNGGNNQQNRGGNT